MLRLSLSQNPPGGGEAALSSSRPHSVLGLEFLNFEFCRPLLLIFAVKAVEGKRRALVALTLCQAEDVDREYPANSHGTVIGWGYTAILRYEASGVGVVDSRWGRGRILIRRLCSATFC